jgi:nucleotide-binding universal stress UspA family protein
LRENKPGSMKKKESKMQKIVAVLNDFDQADLVLGRAIALADMQNAALEILFVHEAPLFTIPDLFSSSDKQTEQGIDKEKIKNEINEKMAGLAYKKAYAVFVFVDDTADRVSAHARDQSSALIVSAYHKKVTEALIAICRLPLLILKNDRQENSHIALPIELSDSARNCIDFSKRLFGHSSIRLLYDHHYLVDEETKKAEKAAFEELKAKTHLEGDYIEEFAWNEADFGEDYETIEKHLIDYIKKGPFDLTILCTQKNDLLSNEALILSLLHELSTDFLVYRHLA